MSTTDASAETSSKGVEHPLAPFRHTAFTIIWTATVVSNIGSWMYSAASGWLMTSLNPDPLIVALVQVATSLPMFLFAIPAGALADIVDRRRFLLIAETSITAISAVFAVLVWLGAVTPSSLLVFTFPSGAGAALAAPAWQAVVAQLVPKPDLGAAVAADSAGINVSRAIGPALGRVIIGSWGIVAPFWFNALSNVGVLAALLWWQPPKGGEGRLPAERFGSAIRTGFRHIGSNPSLRATLVRSIGFFLFASAYWALLPLLARTQMAGGPELYGLLLGAIGFGAVLGAFVLPRYNATFGIDRMALIGSLGTVAALVLFGLARNPTLGLFAALLAGSSWIAVLSSLGVSAQMAVPDWVRGRGLAMVVTAFFGAMSIGSALWGELGGLIGLQMTLYAAALGALASFAATRRWKLVDGATIDLTPSMHWPQPLPASQIENDRGPVLIIVEYRVDVADRNAFLTAIRAVAAERRRDGAYDWDIFEDIADTGRLVETFRADSWIEHLRQHERVTNADRLQEEAAQRFHVGPEPPRVTHFVEASGLSAESPSAGLVQSPQ